ncbi:hypothetical protein N9903_01515 [bacterium]|nr:hypothetical protein [bacterium]
MSEKQNPVIEKIVLAFDICYSSTIIEDLTLTGRFSKWQEFLIATRETVGKKNSPEDPDPYAFTGDGWLIMFPSQATGDTFFGYVNNLATDFHRRYELSILPFLENPPEISGITFGADVGRLLTIDFFGKTEYVGRPINIACRLMNAIKDKVQDPGYKVLLSRPLFNHLSKTISQPELQFHFIEETRSLKNVRNGEAYRCILADVNPTGE